jgi:hypothetical protein
VDPDLSGTRFAIQESVEDFIVYIVVYMDVGMLLLAALSLVRSEQHRDLEPKTTPELPSGLFVSLAFLAAAAAVVDDSILNVIFFSAGILALNDVENELLTQR